MANLLPKTFYIGNDTGSNVYTVSNTAGSYAILRNINICNTTGNNAICSVFVLSPSATPGNNNAILSSFAVSASETVSYDASIVLDAGYKLHIENINHQCTFTISGVEFSA